MEKILVPMQRWLQALKVASQMGEQIASSAAKHPIGHHISPRTLASSDQRYFEILMKSYIVPKYITDSRVVRVNLTIKATAELEME